MTSGIWDRFASSLNSLDEAPEPLRSAMLAALPPDNAIRLLVFGPASKTLDGRWPAALLAVLEREWVVVSGTEEIPPRVARCDFANTLFVEMTSILLYGELRIDFVGAGRAQTAEIHFNTVMERLYQEAVQVVLNGMDGVATAAPVDSHEHYPALKSLPLKFCNAMLGFVPMGQRVLGVVHWPAVLGRRLILFQQELAPAAALALTDRELLLISEEKTRSWLRTGYPSKYGIIVTHCPLSRLEGYHVAERSPLVILDLALRAGGTVGQTVQMVLPFGHKAAVLELVLRAFARKPKGPVAAGEETYGQAALH
jgi:hypothetical protein